MKCIDEEREFCVLSERRRLVRGAWIEVLAHLGAVFSKEYRVEKNGQPPLSVRVVFARMQFEWYRGGLLCFRLNFEAGVFLFVKNRKEEIK